MAKKLEIEKIDNDKAYERLLKQICRIWLGTT